MTVPLLFAIVRIMKEVIRFLSFVLVFGFIFIIYTSKSFAITCAQSGGKCISYANNCQTYVGPASDCTSGPASSGNVCCGDSKYVGATCRASGGSCYSYAHSSCLDVNAIPYSTTNIHMDCAGAGDGVFSPNNGVNLCCIPCPAGTKAVFDPGSDSDICQQVASITTPTPTPTTPVSQTCANHGGSCYYPWLQTCSNPSSSAYDCSSLATQNGVTGQCCLSTPVLKPTNTPTPTTAPGVPTDTGTQNVCTNPCYIVAGANNSCYASTCLSNNPADCAYPMSSMCAQNYSACGVNPVDPSNCQVSSSYTVSTDLPSGDSCVASLPSSITISTTGFPSGKSLYLFWNPGNNQLVAMGHGTTPSFTTPFASAIPSSGLTPGTYALDIFVDPIQSPNGNIGGTYAQIPYTIDSSCGGGSPTTIPTSVVTTIPTGVTGTVPTDTPTLTPTATVTGIPGTTPTDTPTITPTGTSPTGTNNPTKTPTITPSYAPTDTILSLTIGLTGIGAIGDQVNPNDSSLSNQNPVDTTRTVHVYAINNAGQTTYMDGTVNYDSSGDSSNGYYTGTVDMGNLPTGNYQIMAKMDGYLRKAVPSLVQVTAQSTTDVPKITLVAGDINNDNAISILDYGQLMACVTAYYVDGGPDAGCPQSQYTLSDLNDDGVVDLSDYNLWLRNSSVEYGD